MSRILDFWLSGAPWGWWALALILLVLELVTGTTYLLWFAVAAAATGLVMIGLDVGWHVQLAIFALFTMAFIAGGRRFLRPGWLKSDAPDLNEGAARVVGRTVVAVSDFAAGEGRVRLDDTVWSARAADPVAAGDALTVEALDGSVLLVRRRPA